MALKTRRKASGRSQAAVKAAIAPLLEPAMQRSLPSCESRIGRPSEVVFFSTSGKQLVEQEAGVVVAQAVVLVAAVEAVERLSRGGLHPPGMTNTPMTTGISLFVDQLVEDGRRVELDAVLVDVHAGRLGRVVLLGHVDPVVAHGAGEDLALVEGVLRDLALRHGGSLLGLHPETACDERDRLCKNCKDKGPIAAFHELGPPVAGCISHRSSITAGGKFARASADGDPHRLGSRDLTPDVDMEKLERPRETKRMHFPTGSG